MAIQLLLREGDFALLGTPYQLVAQFVSAQIGQPSQFAARQAVELQILQLTRGIQAVETALGADVVDGGGIPEQRVRQRFTGLEGLVHAEQRHHAFHCQPDIEVIAADALAAVAEQIAAAIQLVAMARAHAQHGAVCGAAADIHHQHDGVFIQPRLELEAGRHGFIEELHLLEPGQTGRLGQDGDGLPVALFPCQPLKVDRSTYHGAAHLSAKLLLRLAAYVQHHGADDVFEQGDLGSLEAVGAEEGFRRLDVIAIVRLLQIALQRRSAEAEFVDQPLFPHLAAYRLGTGNHRAAQLEVFGLLGRCQPFGQQAGDGVSVGRVQRGGEIAGTAQSQQPGAALFHHGDGTVGSTVIKSDKHGQPDS